MSSARVIVVIGSTGQQGGAVVAALKGDKHFVVKAATRNPDSDKAKALAKEGIAVIKLDLDNAASCKEALKGAYGVFLVTNYLEIHDKQREIQQGKNVVNAAKENNVQHLVFSGLKGIKEIFGKDGAHHFESKKEIHNYIVQQGVPYTTVDYPFYYENLLTILKSTKNANDEYVLNIPIGKSPMYMFSVAESGELVRQVLLRPDEFKGRWLSFASQNSTLQEIAATLTKVVGKKFVAGTITPEQFAKLPFPGADDLAVMFEFIAAGLNTFDIELTRKLNPHSSTFEQWVEKNRDVFRATYP